VVEHTLKLRVIFKVVHTYKMIKYCNEKISYRKQTQLKVPEYQLLSL